MAVNCFETEANRKIVFLSIFVVVVAKPYPF